MSLGRYRRAASALVALGLLGGIAAGPAYADGSVGIAAAGDCNFPSQNVASTPWSLQRVLLQQLWQLGTGKGVKVAVIDTGVDNGNPQLSAPGKVVNGGSYLRDKNNNNQLMQGDGFSDTVGHGTKVAGIIAAAPMADKTGFVGLAKDATILSYRQNDSQGNGDVSTLVEAINRALGDGANVINISQDVRGAGDKTADFDHKLDLQDVIKKAESQNVVVVASSGNDGREGDTYPAAFPTVLAVGASDRNNERASFSEYGDFVSVVAPGVDMLSTVPKGGQCLDNGTSFSAPYVAGMAAILKQIQPKWSATEIRAVIEQTAQRNQHDRNKFVGWGVVDPLKAAQMAASLPNAADSGPTAPHPDAVVKLDTVPIVPQPLGLAETESDRERRTGTYVLGIGALLVAGLAGGSIVMRDYRRRQQI